MTRDKGRNRRVLIIDDAESIHEDFRKILMPGGAGEAELHAAEAALFGGDDAVMTEPFEADSAFQGGEGLAMVEEAVAEGRPYAMAFVDMRMPPGWDGVETIERLWKSDPDLQVVICTAYSDYTWTEVVERLGQTDRLLLLRKPFDNAEVWQLADALTMKWQLARRAMLKVHELESIVELRTTELRDANTRLHEEVSERRDAEGRLRHQAFHDTLTGLANRALLMERLQRCLLRSQRQTDYQFAVLFIDIDNFKLINDSLGHEAGDELLIAVTQRLATCLRSLDSLVRIDDRTTARLGGDEFVVLLDGLRRPDDAAIVADRVLESLVSRHRIDGHDVTVSGSIGIAVSSMGYSDAEAMLRDADIAMYRAKEQGKGRSTMFDRAMHVQATARLELEKDLRDAIEGNELSLAYQPIMALDPGRIHGFEALVRWTHPHHGDLMPADFVAMAEETGLIVPLGRWALTEACRQLRTWSDRFETTPALSMNVNLSKWQLLETNLVDDVRDALSASGLDPSRLNLEISESALIDHWDRAVATLEQVRSLGVHIQMDDFGTGYSSLNCLHRFPFDVVKIEHGFMNTLGASQHYNAVVDAIIALAHNLGMKVCVEGVETHDQLARVLTLGCDHAQGYYFARPMRPDAVAALLESKDWRKAG